MSEEMLNAEQSIHRFAERLERAASPCKVRISRARREMWQDAETGEEFPKLVADLEETGSYIIVTIEREMKGGRYAHWFHFHLSMIATEKGIEVLATRLAQSFEYEAVRYQVEYRGEKQ